MNYNFIPTIMKLFWESVEKAAMEQVAQSLVFEVDDEQSKPHNIEVIIRPYKPENTVEVPSQ